MRYTLRTLIFTCLILGSCTKIVDSGFDVSPLAIVAEAEIAAGSFMPQISLKSTLRDTFDEVQFNSTILIGIFVNDNPNEFEFRPDSVDKSIWAAPDKLKFEVGNKYKLVIDGGNLGLPRIEAESEVTSSGQFGFLNSPQIQIVTTANGKKSYFDTKFTLKSNSGKNEFYHVIPFLKLNNGERFELNIEDVLLGRNAVIDLEHRHGILIDESLLNELNEISLSVSISEAVDKNELDFPFVFAEIRTVEEDYFNYHQSVSCQAKSDPSPLTIPCLTYSNFSQGGYGLFSIYSAEIDSIAIK